MKDFVAELLQKFREKTCPAGSQPTPDKPIPHGLPPLFSMDNASVHLKMRELAQQQLGISPTTFTMCSPPPYSGDLHKVVEHVHGTICEEFNRYILDLTVPPTDITDLFAKLEAIFFKEITPKSVQQDMKSLEQTFKEVIRLEGAYPARRFR